MENLQLEQLKPLRHALLELHKELLELQKRAFEDQHGQIKTTGEYYLLVTSHAEFQWLRILSALIASMDELLESEDYADATQIDSLISFVRATLLPDKNETEFAGLYFQALQTSPAVAVAHGRVIQILKQLQDK